MMPDVHDRRIEVLRRVLGLSDRLAEFITQHYCPKTMKSDIIDAFYLLLASAMDVVVEGLGTEQALNRHNVLDVVKRTIVGESPESIEYKMYVPTLSDIVAVLNFHYYMFVTSCLSEEHKVEKEKAEEKLKKGTKKKGEEG
jgi:hypothetical protein